MEKTSKIYVAGHRGLVGSALMRKLQSLNYTNIVIRTHSELDLTNQAATHAFFESERPEYVFLAAATVGGVVANDKYCADFISNNLLIQSNVINSAHEFKVKRLLFLGSSCIYPRDCPQPIKEEYLLTGPLEVTNRAYALAKIAGVEQCWSYNRQYRTKFLAVMPTNLYGPGDTYDLEKSHVIPALIRKFHEAKINNSPKVTVWGTGAPYREFMYSDDMADACVYLMNLSNELYKPLLAQNRNNGLPPVINIGVGQDITISELAQLIGDIVGYTGEIIFDPVKPDGTPRKLLDSERMRNLGWCPQVHLKQGLKTAYREFQDRQSASSCA